MIPGYDFRHLTDEEAIEELATVHDLFEHARIELREASTAYTDFCETYQMSQSLGVTVDGTMSAVEFEIKTTNLINARRTTAELSCLEAALLSEVYGRK